MYKITAIIGTRTFFVKELLLQSGRITAYAWTECESLALNFTVDEANTFAPQINPPSLA